MINKEEEERMYFVFSMKRRLKQREIFKFHAVICHVVVLFSFLLLKLQLLAMVFNQVINNNLLIFHLLRIL